VPRPVVPSPVVASPVAAGAVVPRHIGDPARRGVEVEQLPSGGVADKRAAEGVVPLARRIGVHVTVQEQGGPQPGREDVESGEALVRRVGPVAHTAGRGVGHEHVHPVLAGLAAKLA
jgi:hypothetical protein